MRFEKNVGQTDRLIRTLLGVYAMLLGFLFIQGWLGILIGIIGAISLLTGVIGWCGLYTLLGKSTVEADELTLSKGMAPADEAGNDSDSTGDSEETEAA